MIEWRIRFTPEAQADVQSIRDYILQAHEDTKAANDVVERIVAAAKSLAFAPLARPFHPEPRARAHGIRYATAGSYILFFTADEAQHVVTVHMVQHRYRNVATLL